MAERRAHDPSDRLSLEVGEGTLEGGVFAALERALDAGFEDVFVSHAR